MRFSNGSEGDFYREKFCFKCKNYRDKKDGRGFGCPIWDLHILYNREEKFKEVLDFLIPEIKLEDNCGVMQECSMFIKNKKEGVQENESP